MKDWITKLLFRVSPQLGMKRMAKKMGIDVDLSKKGHDVFAEADRVDLIPSRAGHRGFALILDKETAFYFHQEGDKFVYNGYELGSYEKGDVTVFDELR